MNKYLNESIRNCPLCSASGECISFPYSTNFNETLFLYIKCGKCKSIFVDPVPDSDTFIKMYAKSDYHDCHYEDMESSEYSESAQLLKEYLPAGARVLDYGCGLGYFLSALSSNGFTQFGVEFDADAALKASANAACEVLTADDFNGQNLSQFDVIHLGDVLEHLPNPSQTTNDLLKHLKPGGLLFVEGPLEINPSPVYWAARLFGVLKHLILPGKVASHPPTHLFRTGAVQQKAFFSGLGTPMTLKYWQVYETGWPYANGGRIKQVIASVANVMGGKHLLGITFGNRFKAIYVKPINPDAINEVQS